MPSGFDIKCSCGSLSGRAVAGAGHRGNRVVCHCDDCQSFAHFLGRAEDVLDRHGGTEIFQMCPSDVTFLAGREHLAAVRLTPKGLLRWYAGCCNTPIGNTMATPGLAFVGIVNACAHPGSGESSLDGVQGPVRARIMGRFATGNRDDLDAHKTFPPSMMARFMWNALKWKFRRDRSSTPFFDWDTRRPVVEPKILSKDELQDVKRRRDASAPAG